VLRLNTGLLCRLLVRTLLTWNFLFVVDADMRRLLIRSRLLIRILLFVVDAEERRILLEEERRILLEERL
jgi:hypothetical protein